MTHHRTTVEVLSPGSKISTPLHELLPPLSPEQNAEYIRGLREIEAAERAGWALIHQELDETVIGSEALADDNGSRFVFLPSDYIVPGIA